MVESSWLMAGVNRRNLQAHLIALDKDRFTRWKNTLSDEGANYNEDSPILLVYNVMYGLPYQSLVPDCGAFSKAVATLYDPVLQGFNMNTTHGTLTPFQPPVWKVDKRYYFDSEGYLYGPKLTSRTVGPIVRPHHPVRMTLSLIVLEPLSGHFSH